MVFEKLIRNRVHDCVYNSVYIRAYNRAEDRVEPHVWERVRILVGHRVADRMDAYANDLVENNFWENVNGN